MKLPNMTLFCMYMRNKDTFLLQLEYNNLDLFRESTMSRFLDHYQLLVKGVVQN